MTGPLEQRWAQIAGIALIVLTSFMVLRPFFTPIAWAAILAYASWPLHARIEQLLRGRTGVSALLMTILMVLVVMVPAVLVSAALVVELQSAFEELRAWLPGGPTSLAATLRDIPWLGHRAADWIEGLAADPAQMQQWVLARTGLVVGFVASTAGDIGRLALDAILALLTLFFLYRHGRELVPQIHGAARRLAGSGVDTVVHTLGETVRAVMYGTLSTALTQAVLLTFGVWIVGLGSPVLLGAVTGLLALTPIGPPLVYIPAAAWLLLQGRVVAGRPRAPGMGHPGGQHGRQRDQVVVSQRRRAHPVPPRLLRRPRRPVGIWTDRALRGTGRHRPSPRLVEGLDGCTVAARVGRACVRLAETRAKRHVLEFRQ